jgi:hypothetical protein
MKAYSLQSIRPGFPSAYNKLLPMSHIYSGKIFKHPRCVLPAYLWFYNISARHPEISRQCAAGITYQMDVLVITIHSCFDGCFIIQCITDRDAWLKAAISLYRFKTFIYCTVQFITINISYIFCIRADLFESTPANTIIDLYFITDLPIILYITANSLAYFSVSLLG